jgi:hypothetical protein
MEEALKLDPAIWPDLCFSLQKPKIGEQFALATNNALITFGSLETLTLA